MSMLGKECSHLILLLQGTHFRPYTDTGTWLRTFILGVGEPDGELNNKFPIRTA